MGQAAAAAARPAQATAAAEPASAWGSEWLGSTPSATVSLRRPLYERATARSRGVRRRAEELGRRAAWPLAGALLGFAGVSGRLALDIVGGRPEAWVPLVVLFLLATPLVSFCIWVLPEGEAGATAAPDTEAAGDRSEDPLADAAIAVIFAPVALLMLLGVGVVLWGLPPLVALPGQVLAWASSLAGQVLAWAWSLPPLISSPITPVIAGPIAIVVALKGFTALLRRGEARVARADPSARSIAEEERDLVTSAQAWVARMRRTRASIEPATHESAERAAADLYAAAGLAAPRCLWARSPREAAALLDATGVAYGTRPPAVLVGTDVAAPAPPWQGDAGAIAYTVADAWRMLRFQRFEQLVDDSVLWDPSGAGVVGERLPVAPDRSLALYPEVRSEARRLAAGGYAAGAGVRPLTASDAALITLMEDTAGWWCTADAIVLCERPVERVGSSPVRPDVPAQAAYRYADDMWLFMPSGRVATDREVRLLDAASTMDPRTVAQLEPAELRAAVVARMGPARYAEAVASSAELIAAEPDRWIARGALAAFGEARFVTEAGTVIDTDLDAAGRMRRLWRAERRSDAPVVMVEVVNSTPAPDGSRSHHLLRVPPHVRTCGGAVAWTFGMERSDYAPAIES